MRNALYIAALIALFGALEWLEADNERAIARLDAQGTAVAEARP